MERKQTLFLFNLDNSTKFPGNKPYFELKQQCIIATKNTNDINTIEAHKHLKIVCKNLVIDDYAN